ncbi:SDR family NAD(P)-dependent oxidoreductase [Streptomyces sp. NPDC047002]|uniref:SDR family NAD(P)-dependent oxidoreductase n=1 Tax=Streptomyces sp. NPDC047002 TaxID=3155475 RepID=UPI003456B8D3
MELVGTTALVTGGSKGIGYAEADHLMAHGADVVITSRKQDEITAAAAALTAAHPGRRAIGVAADTGIAEDIRRAYDTAEGELGPVAIVVNNAGNSTLDTITELPESDWDSVVDTHLKGTFLSTKEAIARMKASGTKGAIVNTGSVETFGATRGNAHYTAAKAGVAKFTEVAALEAGRYGIRVNTVSPGAVATPIGEGVVTPEFEAAWHRSFSIDRYGEPADIAKAVVFLASDYAGWITGVNLLVDGGSALRGLPDYVHYLLPDQD